jgi:hypothetical protein
VIARARSVESTDGVVDAEKSKPSGATLSLFKPEFPTISEPAGHTSGASNTWIVRRPGPTDVGTVRQWIDWNYYRGVDDVRYDANSGE